METVLLYVTDHGDPSVGIFSRQWTIQSPFVRVDISGDKDVLDYFKNQMITAYNEFSDGKITAEYDFEIVDKDTDGY